MAILQSALIEMLTPWSGHWGALAVSLLPCGRAEEASDRLVSSALGN